MNLSTESGRNWGLESESKSKIERKHQHHIDISNLVNGNTNSHWSLQTLLLWTKYPILLKYMNPWTDSGRKWGLESETKSKIEKKHQHHIDISNLVNGNTNSHWSLQTLLLWKKYPILLKYMILWSDSGLKWGLEPESKSKIERKHLHHLDISNLVNGNTSSHCSIQTLLLWKKYPMLLKYMNLWTDSDRKWGLESESKSKIERKHQHHIDISNLVNGNTNSHWSLQTLLLWKKYPMLLKYMNLSTESGRNWGLESESKSKIERKHQHHIDISNLVNGNTNPHWSLQTLLLWKKYPIILKYMNLWSDSGLKWGLEPESKSKIERKHLHHLDISNLLNGNTSSHCSIQTLLLWKRYPMLLKYMNLWTASDRKWGLESESKSKIERKHQHHIDISNLVNGNTSSNWSLQTLLLWKKYPIILKYMNLWSDSGRKWGLESESKSKIETKHLHHLDISNLVNGNTSSHCSIQTLLLWKKYPIILKYMNLWTDSDRKWGLESESKSKIERKHQHHIDISNLVNGNTNSHWSLQTLLLWTKYPILLKYMNPWTDSGRKWGLESETKSKIEKKHQHHIDISNLVNGNTNSHWSLQTLLLWKKYPILLKYMNLWTDSGRKWGLESESKSKIERKHQHHIDISNLVNGNTNSHWSLQTLLLWKKYPMLLKYMNLSTESGRNWGLESESNSKIERKHQHHIDISNLVNGNTSSNWSLQTLLLWKKYPIILKYMNLWSDSGRKWGLESESKSKIETKHLHHLDISNLVNGNTSSHCSIQTLLLWKKYPIILKYMNLWTDSDRKWGLESESKSKIERKHQHHIDISNLVNGNTNSHWSLQTLLLWTKYPILLKYMNPWTDSGRKWGLESETKSKIEKKHQHHIDISNLVNGNTNSHWSLQTLLLWKKYPILLKYMNLWTDSGRKWGLESESKSKIERKHQHHIDISNLVNGNTNSHWSLQTLLLWKKYPMLLKYMNLSTESGRNWGLESESNSKIERKHQHHIDISNLVNGNTNSHWSLQTLLLWTKYPILLKYMNLWTHLVRKWGLESESKSKIERKHLHHIDISNLVNGNTNSHWSLQTLLLWKKYPILLKYMNLWTDSDREWGLESESKSKIERKHQHHIDNSNLVNGNTNSNWSLQTLLLWTKYPILLKFMNLWTD